MNTSRGERKHENPASHWNQRHDDEASNLPNISGDDGQRQQGTSADQNSIIFILEQIVMLLKIAFQTSSKLVTPAISQMLQSITPMVKQLYEQATPVRIKEWFQIFNYALQNLSTVLAETQQGKEVLSRLKDVSTHSIHLLTSANSRQIIIEGVGLYAKAFEALRTPETKAFLTSLPVLYIRFLDTLSSGEAKYLYHSLSNLVLNIIELIVQEDTTLALAEVTAHLVHVLEREREYYGPWNRKKRKVRKVRHAKVATMRARDATAAASNSKKRYRRNRFISQTYTNRILLKDIDDESVSGMDGDRTVEDAILSSLGDGTRSDNAWLTNLGRNCEDGKSIDGGASLPSKVILPTSIQEHAEDESLQLDELDWNSKHNITADGEDQILDLTYLRQRIKNRGEEDKENGSDHEASNIHTPARSVAGDSVGDGSFISFDKKDSDIPIEDLVEKTARGSNQEVITTISSISKMARELVHEDENVDSSEKAQKYITKDMTDGVRNDQGRGTYSSVAHFYRSLEDIRIKLRKESSSKCQEETIGVGEALGKLNRDDLPPKVQNSKKDSRRFQANIERDASPLDDGVSFGLKFLLRKFLGAIPTKQKIAFGGAITIFLFLCFVWFILGCYGLFFLVQQYLGTSRVETGQPAGSRHENEIILRIVHDASGKDENDLIDAVSQAVKKSVKDMIGL